MILPDPGSDFVWRQTARGPALACRPLEAVARHLFTTRSWPLGQHLVDQDHAEPWMDIADAIGLTLPDLARAHQVHGAAVVAAPRREETAALPEGDILVAGGGAGCAIQTADCVPLLLADPRSGMVAAAHAGWRGLVQRVPQVAIEALTSAAGTTAGDLIAAVGPAIGACCYEVGDDVREAFATAGFAGAARDHWFVSHLAASTRNPSLPHLPTVAREGRWYFDAWRATRDQLLAAGMQPERIYGSDLCTASHAAVFCSYRRDGTLAGRMAAAIRSRAR